MPPGGAMPGGPPGGGGGIGSLLPIIMGALQNKAATNPGQQFSEQASQLQGADPGMVTKQLEKINQILGELFSKTFQILPNVANQISKTMGSLSRAIKESQQGATTQEAISHPPLNQSTAQASQGPVGGGGSDSGAMPMAQ